MKIPAMVKGDHNIKRWELSKDVTVSYASGEWRIMGWIYSPAGNVITCINGTSSLSDIRFTFKRYKECKA